MGLYGGAIFVLLALGVTVFVNQPFGIAASALALTWVTVLYLLLGLFLAAALLGAHDACPLAERLAFERLGGSGPLDKALNYYLYERGAADGGELLRELGIIDVRKVKTDVASSAGGARTTLAAAYTLKPKTLAIFAQLDVKVAGVDAELDGLVAALSYRAANPVYRAFKGFACCSLPDLLGSMWVALTIAGLACWLALLLACVYLARVDRLPDARGCGCGLHTYRRYNGVSAAMPLEAEYDAGAPPEPGMKGWLQSPLVVEAGPSPPPSRESATDVVVTLVAADGRPLPGRYKLVQAPKVWPE
jgi:hypothetical protein